MMIYNNQSWAGFPGHIMRPGGIELTDRLLQLSHLKQNQKILDVGCGFGATVAHLKDLGFCAVGIDSSPENIRHGQELYPQADLQVASGECLPLKDQSVDAVISECSLSVMDLQTVLQACRSVLKSGGKLLISDLYALEPGDPKVPEAAEVSSYLTRDGWTDLLKSSGFKLLVWEDRTDVWKSFAAQALWNNGSLAPLFHCCKESNPIPGKPGYFLAVAQVSCQDCTHAIRASSDDASMRVSKAEGERLPGTVESLCPQCLKRIVGVKIKIGDKVYLQKTCPEHGQFRCLIWNGPPSYEAWARNAEPNFPTAPQTTVNRGCPYDCGLCPEHRQHTCCVLLEVTQRCSLECPVCFASAGRNAVPDPSLETIGQWFDFLLRSGGPFNIQLSGGEPAQREDLPAIIRMGKDKGFPFIQLNTNGLRLASDVGFASALAAAGLDCVFLQFDGISDAPYQILRGRPLFQDKLQAIENCAKAGLGVVLVPTLAKGVNDQEIGKILQFALNHLPGVRGVHFQPISYFGRHGGPVDDRFTLPDVLRAIETQTHEVMRVKDFQPGTAENAYCSFNGRFILMAGGEVQPLRNQQTCSCRSQSDDAGHASRSAEKSRAFVAKQWKGRAPVLCCDAETKVIDSPTESLDEYLRRLENYTLAVSCMAFQDAWNLDLDRLRQCYIHTVSQDFHLIPFCAYNLTSMDGATLYRPRPKE